MTKAVVLNIFISNDATVLPGSVDKVRAFANRGLENDRYFYQTGTYSNAEPKGPGRELTLIEQETLEHIRDEFGITLSGAESRRNILTQNVNLNELVWFKFKIGEILVEGIRPCHPCAQLDKLTGRHVLQALKNRGGLRANILTDGSISVGDEIIVLGSTEQAHGDGRS